MIEEENRILLVKLGGCLGIDKPIWKGEKEHLVKEENGKKVYILKGVAINDIHGEDFIKNTKFGGEFWNFYDHFDEESYYGYLPAEREETLKEGEKYDILFFTAKEPNSVHLIGFYRDAEVISNEDHGNKLKRSDGGCWTHYDLLPDEYFDHLDELLNEVKDKRWQKFLKCLKLGYSLYKRYKRGELDRNSFERMLNEIFAERGYEGWQYRTYHIKAPKSRSFLIEDPQKWTKISDGMYPFSDNKRVSVMDLNRNPGLMPVIKKALDDTANSLTNQAIRNELKGIGKRLKERATKELPPCKSSPIIIYGPPGTGKTWAAIKYALISLGIVKEERVEENFLINDLDAIWKLKSRRGSVEEVCSSIGLDPRSLCKITTFYESYEYEDFVEGARPVEEVGRISYRVLDGPIKAAAWTAISLAIVSSKEYRLQELREKARVILNFMKEEQDPRFNLKSYERAKRAIAKELREMRQELKRRIFRGAPPVFLIIDEVNRGNASRIFGEIITLIENSKRIGQEDETWIELLYSKEYFCLPPNLYILGTMSSTDRSIALRDFVLRRRFKFVEVYPERGYGLIENENARKLLQELNKRISGRLGRDYTIGFTYFMNKGEKEILEVFKTQILPMLIEYFYAIPKELKEVLGEGWFKEGIIEIEGGALKRIDYEKLKKVDSLHCLMSLCGISRLDKGSRILKGRSCDTR